MSKKLLGNKKSGLLFVISAPAGTGKTTLVEMILEEFPTAIAKSCSCTTRVPRPKEIQKKHYDFLSLEEFQKKMKADEFLEFAQVFGDYYGTLKEEVVGFQKEGKHVILVIDTQGALEIKEKNIPAVFIFISPPSMEELRRRLFKRQTENEEKIEERLEWAKREMSVADQYDYHIVNDHLEITYQILRSIFISEEHKRRPYVH
jgi:guanylate kinase